MEERVRRNCSAGPRGTSGEVWWHRLMSQCYIRPISPTGWDRFNLLSIKDWPDFVKDGIISILTPDAHCLLLCRQQSLQLFNAVPRDEIISHVEDDVSDGSYRRQTGQSYVDLIWSLWIQNCQNLHFSQGDDRVFLSWRQQDVQCTAGCTMYSQMRRWRLPEDSLTLNSWESSCLLNVT